MIINQISKSLGEENQLFGVLMKVDGMENTTDCTDKINMLNRNYLNQSVKVQFVITTY